MIALLRRLWCALIGHPGKETIGEDGTVVKTEFSREERGGWLYVTLRAECEEQIGTEVPLITE